MNGDGDTVLQADKSAFKAKKIGGARNKAPGKKEGIQTENIDFAKKIVRIVLPVMNTPADFIVTCQLAPPRKYHRRE